MATDVGFDANEAVSMALLQAEVARLTAENAQLTLANAGLSSDLFVALKGTAVEKEAWEAEHQKLLRAQKLQFLADIAVRRKAFEDLKNRYLASLTALEELKTSSAAREAELQARIRDHETTLAAHSSRGTVDRIRSVAEKQTSATIQAVTGDGLYLYTRQPVQLVLRGPMANEGTQGHVHWFRSSGGSVYTPIYGAGGPAALAEGAPTAETAAAFSYIPSVDDLGCTLRAQFVDSATAACLASEMGPVIPDNDLLDAAVDALKRAEVEYTLTVNDSELLDVVRTAGSSSEVVELEKDVAKARMAGGYTGVSAQTLALGRKRIKICKGRRTHVKVSFEENQLVVVEASRESGTQFTLWVQGRGGPALTCEASDRAQRDVVICVFRLFMQMHVMERDLTARGKSARQDYIERVCSAMEMMTTMNTATAFPAPAFVANSKLLLGVQDLLAQAAQAVQLTAPTAHVQALYLNDQERFGGIGPQADALGSPSAATAPDGSNAAGDGNAAGSRSRRGSLSASVSRAGPHSATMGASASARGRPVATATEYAPADIDDIDNAHGGHCGGDGGDVRGFGDLVPKTAGWDSDSDDDGGASARKAAASKSAGASAPAAAGARGRGSFSQSGPSATSASQSSRHAHGHGHGDDEEDGAGARAPAIRVTIKPKSEAATATAADLAVFSLGASAPPAAGVPLGGGRRGRKSSVLPGQQAAATAALAPTPTAAGSAGKVTGRASLSVARPAPAAAPAPVQEEEPQGGGGDSSD